MMSGAGKRSFTGHTGAFGIAAVLLCVVFGLASSQAYSGAVAERVAEQQAYARTLAVALRPHDVPMLGRIGETVSGTIDHVVADMFPAIPHARYVSVFVADGGVYRSVYGYGISASESVVSESDILSTVYPRVREQQIRTAAQYGGDYLLGRMLGSAGDVVVVASAISAPSGEPYVVVLAVDAGPFARHVVAATALPLAILTLMYVLLVLTYMWLRATVRAVRREQEYVGLLARDIRLPLIGISWAASHLASGTKRKGMRKESLVRDLAVSSSVLDEWIRHIIDHTREADMGSNPRVPAGDIDAREVLDRVVAVYTLYAQARGILIDYAGIPDHIPIRMHRTLLESALLHVFAYVITDGIVGEKIVVAYAAKANAHVFTLSGLTQFAHTPNGLIRADGLLRTEGGSLEVGDEDDGFRIEIRIPRHR